MSLKQRLINISDNYNISALKSPSSRFFVPFRITVYHQIWNMRSKDGVEVDEETIIK